MRLAWLELRDALARWHRTLWGMVVLGLGLSIAGCATGIGGAEMAQQASAVPPGLGRILVYRDASVVGAAVQPEVRINGEVRGTARPGGYFHVDVVPGRYEVSSSTEVTSTVAFVLAEGETRHVRATIAFGLVVGRIELTLVAAEQAERALPGLAYTGPTVAATPSPGAAPPRPGAPPVAGAAPRAVTLDDLDGLLPKKP